MLVEGKELAAMSLDELWTLHEKISAILSGRILSQKRELEKRLAILHMPNEGERMEPKLPAIGHATPRRHYPKVLPRYRNPDTKETWSGRGKRPRWLLAAVSSGRNIEEFRISE